MQSISKANCIAVSSLYANPAFAFACEYEPRLAPLAALALVALQFMPTPLTIERGSAQLIACQLRTLNSPLAWIALVLRCIGTYTRLIRLRAEHQSVPHAPLGLCKAAQVLFFRAPREACGTNRVTLLPQDSIPACSARASQSGSGELL